VQIMQITASAFTPLITYTNILTKLHICKNHQTSSDQHLKWYSILNKLIHKEETYHENTSTSHPTYFIYLKARLINIKRPDNNHIRR
jgi:hypothetical protein